MRGRTDAVKSRARARVLPRRLEPEAAGASRGRFGAVPRRLGRERRVRGPMRDVYVCRREAVTAWALTPRSLALSG